MVFSMAQKQIFTQLIIAFYDSLMIIEHWYGFPQNL